MKKAIKITIVLAVIYAIAVYLLITTASASQVYIARGDPVFTEELTPSGTCWYFPFSGTGSDYDSAPFVTDNKTYCYLSGDQTQDMKPMLYNLVYEEPTFANSKYFKDVSWVNNSLISAFSGVHSINESGKQAPDIMNDLKNLIIRNGFNNYTEDQIVFQDPDLKLSMLYQTQTDIYTAGGTSNMANGTPVTIKIDEDRYYAQHNDTFTYHTAVIRPSDQTMGTWRDDMLMPIQTMPPGWHNITVYAGSLMVTSRFKVDQHEWGPAPTPTEYVNYLSNGDIAPVIVTVPVPEITTIFVDVWHTATPTPDITDALGQKIDYPYSYGDKIPEPVALIGLLCVAALVLVRGYKWKK